jgi:hypothetical protein
MTETDIRLMIACIILLAVALFALALARVYGPDPMAHHPAGWVCPPVDGDNVLEIFSSPRG